VPRQFWADAVAAFVLRTKAANAIIKDNTDLAPRRASKAEGMLRFQSLEQGFETLGGLHAAENLLQKALPGIERPVYQPFQQFDDVIVGFAMHGESGKLPPRNKSRAAAAQLNFDFTEHLDLDAHTATDVLFVVLMVTRDKAVAGGIESIEIGVIDPSYDHFLYCERIEAFVAGYEAAPKPPAPATTSLVKLRKSPTPPTHPSPHTSNAADPNRDKKRS
jgi:hypothetical protein